MSVVPLEVYCLPWEYCSSLGEPMDVGDDLTSRITSAYETAAGVGLYPVGKGSIRRSAVTTSGRHHTTETGPLCTALAKITVSSVGETRDGDTGATTLEPDASLVMSTYTNTM